MLLYLHQGYSSENPQPIGDQMSARMHDVKTREYSLAEGRRLLLDALAVNKKYGTLPHKGYRTNLSLVNRLVLQAPGLDEDADLDEENEDRIDV